MAYPGWSQLEEELAASRKLTEALLFTVPPREGLDEIFLDVINHEYEHARYVRRLRGELGRPDVPEPSGRLVALDTDAEEPPRFFVPDFAAPSRRGRKAARSSAVVSLAAHREEKAAGLCDFPLNVATTCCLHLHMTP